MTILVNICVNVPLLCKNIQSNCVYFLFSFNVGTISKDFLFYF